MKMNGSKPQHTFQIGSMVGEMHPWLLGLQVDGARGVQAEAGVVPNLSIRVKAGSSTRSLI